MKYTLLLIVAILLTGCASEKPDDPKNMNWGAHLYPNEIQQLKSKASNGDVAAANRLASYYDEYLGNGREALIWLRKAADEGDPEAEYNYGIMLVCIDNTPANTVEARKWIEKAARAGYQPAIDKLASLKKGEQI